MDLVWFTDDLLTINMNATDKIKKEKQENEVAKENMKAKTKQTQDPPPLRRSQRTKKNLTIFLIRNFLNNIYNVI
jgi:hypothetical protein